MAALLDLGDVVADVFQKVHVEMTVGGHVARLRWVAPLLPEDDRFTGFPDGAFDHGFVQNGAHAEGAAHLRLKVIVPAVDDVTAVGGVIGIVDRIGAAGYGVGNVVGAFQNAVVLVTIAKLGGPAPHVDSGGIIAVVFVDVH